MPVLIHGLKRIKVGQLVSRCIISFTFFAYSSRQINLPLARWKNNITRIRVLTIKPRAWTMRNASSCRLNEKLYRSRYFSSGYQRWGINRIIAGVIEKYREPAFNFRKLLSNTKARVQEVYRKQCVIALRLASASRTCPIHNRACTGSLPRRPRFDRLRGNC